ncbi:uncharacterized protein [Drosophila bipectinata]|uniref:uncharacterized protein n=1 Tax=Drosophila bipectinata TaxID=42026 RepID=UPI0038B24A05
MAVRIRIRMTERMSVPPSFPPCDVARADGNDELNAMPDQTVRLVGYPEASNRTGWSKPKGGVQAENINKGDKYGTSRTTAATAVATATETWLKTLLTRREPCAVYIARCTVPGILAGRCQDEKMARRSETLRDNFPLELRSRFMLRLHNPRGWSPGLGLFPARPGGRQVEAGCLGKK